MSKPLLFAIGASALLAVALGIPSAQSQSSKTGPITGSISFKGSPPERKAINTSSDPVCSKKKELSSEVIVTKGKLADVHVRLKNGSVGKHKPKTSTVTIMQDGCVYRPRVVGAMVGQSLVIKNKDATMHNVHAYIGKETWFNRSQPKGSPDIVESDIGEPGEVFELKCNVHSWMQAFVPITDHPFFDVSATDGSFTIKDVPVGTYTLEAWHPKYGLKSKSVTVTGSGTKVDFQFP